MIIHKRNTIKLLTVLVLLTAFVAAAILLIANSSTEPSTNTGKAKAFESEFGGLDLGCETDYFSVPADSYSSVVCRDESISETQLDSIDLVNQKIRDYFPDWNNDDFTISEQQCRDLFQEGGLNGHWIKRGVCMVYHTLTESENGNYVLSPIDT